MGPANRIAPQSIVAGGERRDVFHTETVLPGAFLDRPFLLRMRFDARQCALAPSICYSADLAADSRVTRRAMSAFGGSGHLD